MTTQQQIERYATALQDTTDRYLAGYMSHATWDSHMKSLWGTVRHLGLQYQVVQRVSPTATRRAL